MAKEDEASAAAFAALCLAESMFLGMIRGGMMPRTEALGVLEKLAAKIAERSPAHAAAAVELLRFKDELAAKTSAH
jgi:hypothetical protein